jgi:dolichol kinase
VNGATKLAWGLTAFVIVLGAVMWAVTGKAVFVVFLVLGVVLAIGAWLTGRTPPPANRPASKEDTTP